jgi:hypothetical protein
MTTRLDAAVTAFRYALEMDIAQKEAALRELERALEAARKDLSGSRGLLEKFSAMMGAAASEPAVTPEIAPVPAASVPESAGATEPIAPPSTVAPPSVAPEAAAPPAPETAPPVPLEPSTPPPQPSRPGLVEACVKVMGTAHMRAGDIVQRLRARGWLPSSDRPEIYVSQTLSKRKDTFFAVARGVYSVQPDALKRLGLVAASPQWTGLVPGNVKANPFAP